MRRNITYLLALCGMVFLLNGCNMSPDSRNYSKAMKAYEEGEYESAEQLFVKAIDENSDKAEYHLDYAFNLIQLNKYTEAIAEFDRVIMDKDITMVKENNKIAYRGKGIVYIKMYDYTKAIAMFDKALAIKENQNLNNDIMYHKGIALENTGKLEDAVQIYSDILVNNNEEAMIYSARANLYRRLGEVEASIADYDKAIKYAPEDFNAYFGKYFTLKENDEEQKAKETLNLAANIKIETKEDEFQLAKVHFYQENYEAAKVELNTSKENGFTEASYYLAETSLDQGDYKTALNYYLEYEKAGNEVNALYYNQLMVCYLNMGDYEKAKISLNKAKSLSTIAIKEQIMRNEIILLEKTGDFAGALSLMEEYVTNYSMDEETKKDYEFLKTRVHTVTEETEDSSKEENNDNQTTVVKP